MTYRITTDDTSVIFRDADAPSHLKKRYSRDGEVATDFCRRHSWDPSRLLPCDLRDIIASDILPFREKYRWFIAAGIVEVLYRDGHFSGIAGAAENRKGLRRPPFWKRDAFEVSIVYT